MPNPRETRQQARGKATAHLSTQEIQIQIKSFFHLCHRNPCVARRHSEAWCPKSLNE
ncbi:uncharacterized protein BKA78DRAFT_315647 [Phyllosticta capitalensis]|uniref:uncharacterized protein n=1 Tax=Phyllosticta capitalensis TaxID=121624 RepID=UPI00312F26EF